MIRSMKQQGIVLAEGPINPSTVVVVGDVHGCANALADILAEVKDTGCTLVFVGDLIDRGPLGVEVLTTVRGLLEDPSSWGLSKVVVLAGNHERMALDAIREVERDELRFGPSDYGLWIDNGGDKRDLDYLMKSKGREWLASLPLFYEHPKRISFDGRTPKLLVTHASVDPYTPLSSQDPDILQWDRHVCGYGEDYVTVNGHTICKNKEPVHYESKTGTVLRIDTGSFWSGIVTAVAFTEV